MPIKFSCPNCKKPFSVRDELAGKRTACPACKKPLTIPKPAPGAAPIEDIESLALATLREEPAAVKPVVDTRTIDFNCPQCDEPIKVPIELEGKQAPCPECRRIIKVPLRVKRDPTDWRQAATAMPTAARRDTEPAPEGAWGSVASTLVSREALEEAAPIKRRPLTRGQKIRRGAYAAGGLVVAGVGVWFVLSFFNQRQQDKAYAKVLETLASDKGKAALDADSQGALYLGLGEYRLASNTPAGTTEAVQHFAKARQQLSAGAGPDRDLMLADLALAQIELGGDKGQVERGVRLKWDEACGKEVRPTLTAVKLPEGKVEAARLVTRRLIEKGQDDQAVALVRQIAAGPEGPEVLAVAGLELFRTGNKKLAQNVAQQATAASGSPGAGKGEPATVSPSLVSLCIVLGQQQPAPGKEPDDANTFLVGQLGGLARQGPMDLGRVKAIEDPQVRLRALVAVARGTQESKGDATPVLQEAAALLEGELKGKPLAPWLLMQAVRIGVDAGLAGEKLAAFADSIAALPLKARAALEILRAKLDRLDGKADDAMLSAIDPTPRSLAGLLARQAIARHNASRDSDAYKAAEGSQDPEAAFAFLGVALGLQDKKK